MECFRFHCGSGRVVEWFTSLLSVIFQRRKCPARVVASGQPAVIVGDLNVRPEHVFALQKMISERPSVDRESAFAAGAGPRWDLLAKCAWVGPQVLGEIFSLVCPNVWFCRICGFFTVFFKRYFWFLLLECQVRRCLFLPIFVACRWSAFIELRDVWEDL